jgi:hypothetical protein
MMFGEIDQHRSLPRTGIMTDEEGATSLEMPPICDHETKPGDAATAVRAQDAPLARGHNSAEIDQSSRANDKTSKGQSNCDLTEIRNPKQKATLEVARGDADAQLIALAAFDENLKSLKSLTYWAFFLVVYVYLAGSEKPVHQNDPIEVLGAKIHRNKPL